LFGWVGGSVIVGLEKKGGISIVFCESRKPQGLPGVIEGIDGGREWDSGVVSEESSKGNSLKGSGK
jgi:hypothetical protein